MKRTFTKLMAALALLLFIAPPMVGWGQTTWTRVTTVDDLLAGGTFILGYEATANSGTIVPMQNQGTATTSTAGYMYSGTTIGTSGNGTITMSNVTSTSLYEVTIVASTKVNGAICIKIGDNYLGNTDTKNNCTLFTSESTTTSFTPTAKTNNTFELKIEANGTYYDLQYNTGSPRFAVYGGGQKHPVIYKKEVGENPTITFDSESANLGIKGVGDEFTTSFTVSQENLDEGITLTVNGGGTVSPNTIGQGEGPTEVTWTYTPTTAGSFNITITATSEGADPVTFTITGEAKAYHNITTSGITNGTVTADPTQAYEGQYVNLIVSPNQGYGLDELMVVDANNTPIEYITFDAYYRFQMPDSEVTVNATFVEVGPIVTDELDYEFTGISGSGYKNWSGKTGESGAVYAGNSNAGVSYIQLRTTNSNSGIVTTTSGGKVSKVTVEWAEGNTSGRSLDVYGKNSAYSDATDLYNNSNQGTKLGSITYGTSTVLTISGNYSYIGLRSASNAIYLDEIDIDWETDGTPSISANDVEITYDATNGSIAYTIDNEPDPAGTLTADIKTGTTPTIADFALGTVTSTAVPFTCSANNSGTARTAVVTLTYTYNSQTITKDVTITQAADPNYVMTIAEARAQATGSSVCTQGIVTSISGSSAFIQDATAAINVYGNSTLVVGQKYKVSGTLDNYNGLLEITDPTCTLVEGGSVIAPEVMTIADILTSNNQGWFIKIEGATVGTTTSNGNTTLTQGESSIVARNLSGAEEGDVINLTGNISVYNSTKQIANPLVVADPSITVDEDEITLTYQVGATEAPQGILLVEGSNLQGPVTVSLTGSNFKISGDGGTTWGTEEITLNHTGGTLEESMIGVMLNTGLGLGTYEGTITLTSANASTVTVSLTGTVTNQTYAINLNQPTTGGTIAADKETAEAGQTVMLTATPATGYAFGTWTVLDDQAQAVTVTNNQFTMPASDVEVGGSFSQIDYAIAVAETTNGTVVCSGQTAHYGEEVLVTVTPADGYRVQSLTVTETNGQGTVTDIEEAEGIYSFNMPAYNVTITVVFATGYTSGIFNKINSLDDLEDGAYYVIYDTKAMNSTLSSGAMGATVISPEGTVFNNPPAAIVWKLEANGTNWNLYNEDIDKYCYIDGNSSTSFATGETSTYSYTVTAPSQGEFVFKSTHTNHRCISLSTDGNSFRSFAASNNPTVQLYKFSTAPSIAINPDVVNATATGTQGVQVVSLSLTYANIEVVTFESFAVQFYNAQGQPVENIPAETGVVVGVTGTNAEGYQVSCAITDNTGGARSVYFKVYAIVGGENVYSNLVTVNQAAAPQPYTLTVSTLDAHITNMYVFNAADQNNPLIDDGQAGDATVVEGTEIHVSPVVEGGYILASLTVMDGDDSPVATENHMSDGGYYSFTMPASNVTVSATTDVEPVIVTYTLATEIVAGKHYIITNGKADGTYKAMGSDAGNNRNAVDVTIANNVASVTDDAGVYEFIIYSEGDDIYSIYDETTGGYLFAASKSSNHLKTKVELDDNGKWTISINADNVATIVAQGANTHNVMRYNNGSTIFSCYLANNSQQDIYLFQRENDPIMTYSKTIEGYGTSKTDKYYLIASPVVSIAPSTSNGFLTNDYDLYCFDQTQEAEWRNYKKAKFTLVPGMGYLYARSVGGNLTFTGTPYNGDGKVSLVKDDNAQFPGWNLVGNPWGIAATIDSNRDYYVMNAAGNEVEAGTDHVIDAMEGIFVIAAEDGEELTFMPQTPNSDPINTDAMVVMNVTRNRGNVIDRAIVRFGEGRQLPKFQLNPNHTKVYFSQGNEDYAVVRSANEGEMPVSFKAETRGTYTLNVNAENVEMTYLHLIDNMTGADVDLLATPSYSFEAKTTDYASRFRLVFSANNGSNENGNETFAYYNGSEWVINNPSTGSGDNATLQVVDMMGRVLSSETISGNANVNINQAAGIYMLRLVNGENVMVQKVVVR